MQRTLMKSKLHRATVTEANLEYEGSITIDRDLLRAADIWVFERVEVYNITNGQRFATYAIEGTPGSGVVCVNGAAAHLVTPGDKVIICSYATGDENEMRLLRPKVVLLGENNRPKTGEPPRSAYTYRGEPHEGDTGSIFEGYAE